MSDTHDKLYKEIVHYTVRNINLGLADAALFYYTNYPLLKIGLVETWEIKSI